MSPHSESSGTGALIHGNKTGIKRYYNMVQDISILPNLAKDLTRLRGKGYSRSNLFNMRLFYVRFQKIQTVSGQLSGSSGRFS